MAVPGPENERQIATQSRSFRTMKETVGFSQKPPRSIGNTASILLITATGWKVEWLPFAADGLRHQGLAEHATQSRSRLLRLIDRCLPTRDQPGLAAPGAAPDLLPA